jgi:hypothetical protein
MAFPRTFVISRLTVVTLEQWFCFLLGIACMASGAWGTCARPSQALLPTWLTWLGSAYVPTLRVIAIACLGSGAALVRLGFAKTPPKSELPYLKLTIKPGSSEARQGPVRTARLRLTMSARNHDPGNETKLNIAAESRGQTR